MFQYSDYVSWLTAYSERLAPFVKPIIGNHAVKCFGLSVSGPKVEAELVVWENGNSSMMIYDISKDGYILSNSRQIMTESFAEELENTFFKPLIALLSA
jgi:hypothetical protein